VREGRKKSERPNAGRDFQYFVVGYIGESFQNEIFAAKHVPCVRRRTSAGWTHGLLVQAGFQSGAPESHSPRTENRELALSNGKGGTSRFKKLNLYTGVYTKVGRYLFHDSKGILRVPSDEAAD
jgi:hypothetical protein